MVASVILLWKWSLGIIVCGNAVVGARTHPQAKFAVVKLWNAEYPTLFFTYFRITTYVCISALWGCGLQLHNLSGRCCKYLRKACFNSSANNECLDVLVLAPRLNAQLWCDSFNQWINKYIYCNCLHMCNFSVQYTYLSTYIRNVCWWIQRLKLTFHIDYDDQAFPTHVSFSPSS